MTLVADPRVSVVMAAYNVALYIEQAVTSILQQTYTDFELIVIDDGSTDGTWEVLERLASQDARIRLARNLENMGISHTRNRLTEMARGDLIAVMDSDDWCLLDRLEKQVTYLDQYPEVGVVGGQILYYWEKDGKYSPSYPLFALTPGHAAWTLHFSRPVLHPTVMMRRSLLVDIEGYRPEFDVAHDCDLWQRLSHHTKFANLPDIVVYYRRHESNITRRRRNQGYEQAASIAQRSIEATLGTHVPLEDMMCLMRMYDAEPRQIGGLSRRMCQLVRRFGQTTPVTPDEWRLVKHDAATTILWMARRQTPWSRHGAPAFCYAMRLDPVSALQWLDTTAKKSARYRLGFVRPQGAGSQKL